jgi:hypothetical protein
MANHQASLVSDHVKALCGHCGATIWNYSTPNGKTVPLDAGVGPYIIIGTKAYRGGPTDGYRDHFDHCKSYAVFRNSHVSSDEFLWP